MLLYLITKQHQRISRTTINLESKTINFNLELNDIVTVQELYDTIRKAEDELAIEHLDKAKEQLQAQRNAEVMANPKPINYEQVMYVNQASYEKDDLDQWFTVFKAAKDDPAFQRFDCNPVVVEVPGRYVIDTETTLTYK